MAAAGGATNRARKASGQKGPIARQRLPRGGNRTPGLTPATEALSASTCTGASTDGTFSAATPNAMSPGVGGRRPPQPRSGNRSIASRSTVRRPAVREAGDRGRHRAAVRLRARELDGAARRRRTAAERAAAGGDDRAAGPDPYGPALAMAGGSAPEAVPPTFAELWAAIEAYRIWNESWPKTGRQNEDRMGGRTRIAVRIGPSMIDTVSWFFNAGLDDILHEMLHDARRACAPRVDIVTGEALGISDDGCRLDDQGTLLAFGGRRWDAATTSAEDARHGMLLTGAAAVDD